MTLRRLFVLLRGLPPDALFRAEFEAAQRLALKPLPEKIRERQAHYDRMAAAAERGGE